MMVLGSILILTVIAVEFAYNSHVSYELSSSERDRLKAYYLARSAYNLTRLEIRYEREMRSRFAGLLRNLGGTGVTSDPLCKQVPLSTGLLKGITSGILLNNTPESEDSPKPPPKSTDSGMTDEGDMVSGAEDFLSFGGDFEASCDPEERRINLNVFRSNNAPSGSTGSIGESAVSSAYEAQKALLFSLMSQKDFEPIFKGKPDLIRKVVTAIADWADRDDRINEAPGVSGGLEDSEYTDSQYHYKVKNGKYTSLEELLLVAGVGDELYRKLEPNITVYGDNKINLCQSSEEMIKAFILKTIQTTPGLPPINPEDEPRWVSVLQAVQTACDDPSPQPGAIASAIATALGSNTIPGLANAISTTNRFYRIESIGQAGESHVRLTAVIDTSQGPNFWKTVYFRVE